MEEEPSEDTMLELSTCSGSPELNTHTNYHVPLESEDSKVLDSITGKLKRIFPTLFSTLTSWEKDILDTQPSLSHVISPPSHNTSPPTLAPTSPPHTSHSPLSPLIQQEPQKQLHFPPSELL
jgi:hypothetical protein